MPGGDVPLGKLPQLDAIFTEASKEMARLERYSSLVESELADCLRRKGIPGPDLVERIAVAKIGLVEKSLQLCFRLKQEVGSYALMVGTGFEHVECVVVARQRWLTRT